MRSWALLWAAASIFVATACGSSTHGTQAAAGAAPGGSAGAEASAGHATGGAEAGTTAGGASSAAPIELTDLCPIFTHDLCVYLMQCGGVTYRDAAHCEKELDCFGLPELTAAAKKGAVDYDPSQVGACHQRFVASPCTFGFFLFTPDIYDVLKYCPGTVTPKLVAGDSCSSDGECSAGLYCYKGASYACPGTCRAFSTAGQDCGSGGRCAEGLDCKADKCVAYAKAGDDCATDDCDYSISCPKDEICASNLWCDKTVGQCQLGRMLGEPCGTLGTGATTSQANCAVHLWCDAPPFGAGKCQAPSAAGGPCAFIGFDSCEDGLHCEGATQQAPGKCSAPSASGGNCNGDKDCQKGLVCLLNICSAPGAEGVSCEDGSCQSGLVCVDGKCLGARYPGDPCDGMRCTGGRCVNGTCDYHVKVGGACSDNTDCATSQCVNGVCYDDSICKPPAP